MTDEEKHNLSRYLEVYLKFFPDNIVAFLQKHASNGNEIRKDENEVDINDIENDSLFRLGKMLDDHVLDEQNHIEAVLCY